jgi:hypothetical protein
MGDRGSGVQAGLTPSEVGAMRRSSIAEERTEPEP